MDWTEISALEVHCRQDPRNGQVAVDWTPVLIALGVDRLLGILFLYDTVAPKFNSNVFIRS